MTDNLAPCPELLPCPFCGSTAIYYHKRDDGIFSWMYCGPCGTQGPVEEGKIPERTAQERWNTRQQSRRADPGPSREAFDELISDMRELGKTAFQWSGSAFLANERMSREYQEQHKGALYSWLCRLGNCAAAWEESIAAWQAALASRDVVRGEQCPRCDGRGWIGKARATQFEFIGRLAMRGALPTDTCPVCKGVTAAQPTAKPAETEAARTRVIDAAKALCAHVKNPDPERIHDPAYGDLWDAVQALTEEHPNV